MTKVLSVGLHPSVIDFSPYPGQNAETLTAQIRKGHAAVRAAGYDDVLCLVGTDPDDAEGTVRERLAEGPFDLVLIGAGVRMSREHTPLLERLVNLLVREAPGVRFCFNTSPETTIDAIRRWA